jgi:hypothetical protein
MGVRTKSGTVTGEQIQSTKKRLDQLLRSRTAQRFLASSNSPRRLDLAGIMEEDDLLHAIPQRKPQQVRRVRKPRNGRPQ